MTALPSLESTGKSHSGPSFWRVFSWQMLGLLLILGLWYLVTDVLKIYEPYVFPGPSAVWTEISYGLWGTGPQDGKLLEAIRGSMQRVLTGYGLALILGSVIGLIMGMWMPLRVTLGSYLTGIQSIPSIAFVPFAIIFFKDPVISVLAVVILEGFIPIALAVSGAMLNVSPALKMAGRTLGAHGLSLMTRVIIPSAVPNILTALRTSWSFAWRALVGAEILIAGSRSLGDRLEIGRNTANVELVLATIIIIGIIGGLFDMFLRTIEGRVRRNYGLEGNQ